MPSILFLFAFLIGNTIGAELRISNVDQLIQFKDNINAGANYNGTTVLLDSDLSFAGKTFEPIGYYTSWHEYNGFLGVFDGQGHVISNLTINSSSQYVGLFGYSKRLAIRNVILDSSCSITSSFSDSDDYVYLGGIIGYCGATNGPCTIENSVNMGSASFNGNMRVLCT